MGGAGASAGQRGRGMDGWSGRGGSRDAFPADLPVLEERSRRGEALEGHDRPPAAGGGTVAPAEGLSAPGPRARGPLSQLPAPSRGSPGQGPAGQRPGSRGSCGRTGTEPPRAPAFASPWGAGGAEPPPTPAEEAPEAMYPPNPYSHHRAGLLRVLPAPLPEPLGPSPASPPPLPLPPIQGVRLRMQEGPSSLPFQLHKTSRSRQRSHGAPPAPPRPRCAPLEPPGTGGGHRGKGTAPFPGIGSHDTVPYPKRAPSCTAFSRVRCFTSVLGLARSGGSLSRPGDPRTRPPPRPGLEGAPRGMRSSTGSPSSRADLGCGAAPGAHPWG